MTRIHKHATELLILLILLAAAALRLSAYGDLRLSVGYTDTPSYVRSADAPWYSWKMFAGTRLFTPNLIYKLAHDPVECPLIAVSYPAAGLKTGRVIQPCFDRIAVLQNVLSMLAWSSLAWTFSRGLKHPALRVIGASVVVIFAFTPQIAEWDFVLSPESLSLSLFALVFALTLGIAFRISQAANPSGSGSLPLMVVAWLVSFFLWVFVRDVHLYTILPTVLLVVSILFFKDFRRSKLPVLLAVALCGIFLLGYRSAGDSLRASSEPLQHAFAAYIFPYPERVSFMKGLGMPAREAEAFQGWLDAHGAETYGLYLLTHPGFVLATLGENSPYFECDFEQPYFKARDVRWREALMKVGGFLHPKSLAVYSIDLLILFALIVKAAALREPRLWAWTWLAAWFLSCALLTLLPSFFGDTDGIRRHIFPSVEMLRLFLWVFLLVHLDRDASSALVGQSARLPAWHAVRIWVIVAGCAAPT
jgi:hypothetical protein